MKRLPKKQSKSLLKKKIKAQNQRSRRVLIFVCFFLVVLSVWAIAYFVKVSGYKSGRIQRTYNIVADFQKLPPLSEGSYELWVYGEGLYASIGQFNIEGDGLVDEEGAKIRDGRFKLETEIIPEKILVSVESDSENTRPSQTIILKGTVHKQVATLSCEPCQFSIQEPLTYILQTPTDGNAHSQEYAGIWFIKMVDGKETPGFPISNSPKGFSFEGWINYQNRFLSMGRFSQNDKADSLMIYSSLTSPGPDLPGEDFLESAPEELRFPAKLNDGEVLLFVTLEPDQEGVDPTGDEPFALYIYRGTIEKNAKSHQNYQIPQVLKEYLPTGVIKIRR